MSDDIQGMWEQMSDEDKMLLILLLIWLTGR